MVKNKREGMAMEPIPLVSELTPVDDYHQMKLPRKNAEFLQKSSQEIIASPCKPAGMTDLEREKVITEMQKGEPFEALTVSSTGQAASRSPSGRPRFAQHLCSGERAH